LRAAVSSCEIENAQAASPNAGVFFQSTPAALKSPRDKGFEALTNWRRLRRTESVPAP
jgi:hypothetical protein